MTTKQVTALAIKVAEQYRDQPEIRRSDVIRDVVRTKKLNLDDSIILAECIIKGLLAAGKTIVIHSASAYMRDGEAVLEVTA